jgi:YQGE family putative transporter
LTIPCSCLTFDVMGRLPEARHRNVEYVVVREASVNLGRCLSLLLVIISQSQWQEKGAILIAFLLVGLSAPLALLFYSRTSSRFLDTFFRVKA